MPIVRKVTYKVKEFQTVSAGNMKLPKPNAKLYRGIRIDLHHINAVYLLEHSG